jgi:hypothetical protein
MAHDGTGFAQTLLPHAAPAHGQSQGPAPAAAAMVEADLAPTPQPTSVYTVVVNSGLVTSVQSGAATDWVLSPSHFELSVITTIPATEIDLAEPAPAAGPTKLVPPSPYTVYIRPMKAVLESSVLTVTVKDDTGMVVPFATDFSFESSLADVPAAKWGEPPDTGEDPNDNEVLPGRLMGVGGIAPTKPPLTPSGVDALAMEVETTFGYDVVDDESPYTPDHLPLDASTQPSGTSPVVDPGAFTTIGNTLTAVSPARKELFTALADYGVHPGTNGALDRFALEPGAYLTGDPLMQPATA